MNIFKLATILVSLFSFTANANEAKERTFISLQPTVHQLTEDNRDYDFEGIVGLSNCSGSIVRYENSRDSDQAMVLTNGHCLRGGMPGPGEVRVNQSNNRTFKVLNSDAEVIGNVKADKLIYATMTKTDMAIYRLKETFNQIYNRFGVRPLTMSSTRSNPGTGIEIISGYWKRGFACYIERIVPTLKESKWTWNNSIRYTRPGCEIFGGTSGSPVIELGTRTVIGVNNTINESGRSCTLNNPCEVDETGKKTQEKGVGYGQQTFWIYSCLDDNNELDLNKMGCQLPK